jgi:hypothetical protein
MGSGRRISMLVMELTPLLILKRKNLRKEKLPSGVTFKYNVKGA